MRNTQYHSYITFLWSPPGNWIYLDALNLVLIFHGWKSSLFLCEAWQDRNGTGTAVGAEVGFKAERSKAEEWKGVCQLLDFSFMANDVWTFKIPVWSWLYFFIHSLITCFYTSLMFNINPAFPLSLQQQLVCTASPWCVAKFTRG